MKKLLMILAAFLFVFTLTACDSLCVGPECIVAEDPDGEDPDGEDPDGENPDGEVTLPDNFIPFTHINGEGHETDKLAYVLLEYKLRDYVKYQVTYLSCTCRPGDFNYWNVVFVEISRDSSGVIQTVSFDSDGDSGHYTAGMWGDSSGAPEQNGVTFEELDARYFPWYIGKTAESLDGIDVWSNGTMYGSHTNTGTIDDQTLVDDFAGSSVSTNNFLRVMKELLDYHNEKYGS